MSNLQILLSSLIGGREETLLPAGNPVLVAAAKLSGPLFDLVHLRWLESWRRWLPLRPVGRL